VWLALDQHALVAYRPSRPAVRTPVGRIAAERWVHVHRLVDSPTERERADRCYAVRALCVAVNQRVSPHSDDDEHGAVDRQHRVPVASTGDDHTHGYLPLVVAAAARASRA